MRLSIKHRTNPNSDITVIIRGSGERTEQLCHTLLSDQISKNNIHLIHEVPFSKALKKSYRIGIEANRAWTLVIDADVLIRSGLISELANRATNAPSFVFAIQTEILDKFFGGNRVGGVKLYRTKLLPEALKIAPDVNNRPEGFVIKHMHQQGYYVDITQIVCGLHDFDQYYSDIFRKGFQHGVKHAKLTELIFPYWQRQTKTDKDFELLLAGFKLAKKYQGELVLDKNGVRSEFEAFMKKSKLNEKPKLDSELGQVYVDNLLRDFKTPPEFRAVNDEIVRMGKPTLPKSSRLLGRWFGKN